MADKITVYSKRMGEPSIPVTVRVQWFADGTIKPLLFWTPDNLCYEIKHIYEMIPLAFLKDRGVGIRFKVKSQINPNTESDFDCKIDPFENYLYFADDWFCGKNFIDERYTHKGKEYIPVTLDIFPNGEYEIIYFEALGTRYMVEKTISVEPRGSFNAGGVGIYHKVRARQTNFNDDEDPNPLKSIIRNSALYFEVNKWFVAVKTS